MSDEKKITDADIEAEVKKHMESMGMVEKPASTKPVKRDQSKEALEGLAGPSEKSDLSPEPQTALGAFIEGESTKPGEAPRERTSSEIAGDLQRNLINQVSNLTPNEMKASLAGAATGYLIPKASERFGPGSTYSPENELLNRQNKAELEMRQAQPGPFQQYVSQSQNLAAQRNIAQQAHIESLMRLNEAKANLGMVNSLSHDIFLPEEFRLSQGAPSVTLNRQPIGGEATSKYAEKFGLTPQESLEAPSMSKVQQKIPSVAQSITTAQRVGPGFQKFEQSPLLLGPEGQSALQQKHSEEMSRQARVNEANAQAKAALAQRIADAQRNVETAEKLHAKNQEALEKANQNIKLHTSAGAPTQTTPEEEMLKRKIGRYEGVSPTARVLTSVGKVLFPRATPMVAGALAPLQAHASKKAFEQGQTGRGLAYGAGALGNVLQMTGFLPAMGAGALLNIPAAYYEAEDLLKPPGALPAGNQ